MAAKREGWLECVKSKANIVTLKRETKKTKTQSCSKASLFDKGSPQETFFKQK